MFTGIVEGTAPVRRLDRNQDSLRVWLDSPLFAELRPGDSVSVNGVCLTLESREDNLGGFFLSAETLEKSNLGRLQAQSPVNIERAARIGDRNSGHWVQGHVDGRARCVSVTPRTESREIRFEIPSQLSRYLVKKGSVALDGVSLTVNSVDENSFSITVVPHTWEATTFRFLKSGAEVNLEIDVIAKYVEKLCQGYR